MLLLYNGGNNLSGALHLAAAEKTGWYMRAKGAASLIRHLRKLISAQQSHCIRLVSGHKSFGRLSFILRFTLRKLASLSSYKKKVGNPGLITSATNDTFQIPSCFHPLWMTFWASFSNWWCMQSGALSSRQIVKYKWLSTSSSSYQAACKSAPLFCSSCCTDSLWMFRKHKLATLIWYMVAVLLQGTFLLSRHKTMSYKKTNGHASIQLIQADLKC